MLQSRNEEQAAGERQPSPRSVEQRLDQGEPWRRQGQVLKQGGVEFPVCARMIRFLADESAATLIKRRIVLPGKSGKDCADEKILQDGRDETDRLHNAGRYGIGVAPCAGEVFGGRQMVQVLHRSPYWPAAGWGPSGEKVPAAIA